MKIGYFCNTTNWKKKPYTEILNNARDIATYCDKNNWDSIWFTEHHLNHEGMEVLRKSINDVYRYSRKNKTNKIGTSL